MKTASHNNATASTSIDIDIEAAKRHVCQEARMLLQSLRGGPPGVARGDLAHNLVQLRRQIIDLGFVVTKVEGGDNSNGAEEEGSGGARSSGSQQPQPTTTTTPASAEEEGAAEGPEEPQPQGPGPQPSPLLLNTIINVSDPFLQVVMDPRAYGPHTLVALRSIYRMLEAGTLRAFHVQLHALLRGVLACKFEQTDAGADEAVEMAIADVLCRIIMTDNANNANASASASAGSQHSSIPHPVIVDAFNTVFVTRNTYVHSPALCYHFEDVLTKIVKSVFGSSSSSSSEAEAEADESSCSTKILEFLVNQLLHTPLVGGDNLDESIREARQAHDDTRILCLRLTRIALDSISDKDITHPKYLHIIQDDLCLSLLMTGQAIWAYHDFHYVPETDYGGMTPVSESGVEAPTRSSSGGGGPGSSNNVDGNGIVSLEVLSEVCSTLSQIWNRHALRPYLVSQMEAVFTGFYTRALVLLRKRRNPHTSHAFDTNLLFDAEVEIILESLIDILCIHNATNREEQEQEKDGYLYGGGALVNLFVRYDCDLHRSDVASFLILELCRCCGAYVDKETGDALVPSRSSSSLSSLLSSPVPSPPNSGIDTPGLQQLYQIQQMHGAGASGTISGGGDVMVGDGVDPAAVSEQQQTPQTPPPPPAPPAAPAGDDTANIAQVEHDKIDAYYRHVPAHLKELCAQAVVGSMRCLFIDDVPSEETLQQRYERKRSIMLRQVGDVNDIAAALSAAAVEADSTSGNNGTSQHYLRDIKSKKRLLRKAARIFNKKSSRGIEFLLDSGLLASPVKPIAVASFLRNAIVMGLDKKSVGMYLGEAGKGPKAGKSPPDWERDWFHREVLTAYCSLFKFENQSLLDGLRMFLAAFRLPGEAQQIDRILQAFSDRCCQVCEESSAGVNGPGRLRLFSEDPKRASDAAYLLSFSIIMLNTDRHNKNIREDRKMSCQDFIKNNTDYGRDITEKGKEFPPEYLEGIYHSINEEEIRTEGEGAEGEMTVERWKDVLRGINIVDDEGKPEQQDSTNKEIAPSVHDAEDVTELVLEHVWKPIVSAVGALWGVSPTGNRSGAGDNDGGDSMSSPMPPGGGARDPGTRGIQSGMLGAQGGRLGMDMALEMLKGVRQLGRIDIFRKIFTWVCDYTGLLGDYSDPVTRTWAITKSIEEQSAVLVALNTAIEAGEDLDEDSWKRMWLIIFELRDLKLIPLRSAGVGKTMLVESVPDLLTESARREWIICQIKGDMNFDLNSTNRSAKPKPSILGAFGRALFGGVGDVENEDDSHLYEDYEQDDAYLRQQQRPSHGKDDLIVWDDCGPSDDEADDANKDDEDDISVDYPLTAGEKFESQLVRESIDMSKRVEMPVTGLERVDETKRYHDSPRALVRERFRQNINMKALVSDTKFMNDAGVVRVLHALTDLIACARRPSVVSAANVATTPIPARRGLDRSPTDSGGSFDSLASYANLQVYLPISPASEALAEVMLCEIAIKNKDRLKLLWEKVLQDHYLGQLTSLLLVSRLTSVADATAGGGGHGSKHKRIPADPGLEKRVTGLLHISHCAVTRRDNEISNEVLSAWKFVLPASSNEEEQQAISPLRVLDRHFGEGLWRIASEVDSLSNKLNSDGWEGLFALLKWCASRGGYLKPVRYNEIEGRAAFSEDDPALQSYRALHLMLNTAELVDKVPDAGAIESLRILALVGERRQYAQLSIAALDLFHLLLEKRMAPNGPSTKDDIFWTTCWRKIAEGIAEVAEKSCDSNVRQHALSMLTDLFLDKSASSVPPRQLCSVLSEVCVPLAGRSILKLRTGNARIHSSDELMIEFELCIGLIFKPLRQHLPNILDGNNSDNSDLSSTWKSVLNVLEGLLCDNDPDEASLSAPPSPGGMIHHRPVPGSMKVTMDNLANEHLRNAIVVLISNGVILTEEESKSGGDLTSYTIASVGRMGISKSSLEEWKQQVATQ